MFGFRFCFTKPCSWFRSFVSESAFVCGSVVEKEWFFSGLKRVLLRWCNMVTVTEAF